jgi:2'-5' RNA ligase
MNPFTRVTNAIKAFAGTNQQANNDINGRRTTTDFWRSAKRMVSDWSQVEMTDQDMYTGYSYAAIRKRANRASALGKKFLKTEAADVITNTAKKKGVEIEHPYLTLVRDSKEFSQRKFWHDISTYLDLEGVYYLMAVRAVGQNKDGTTKVGAVQKFVMMNPYNVKRVLKGSTNELGGYVESINGIYREIPKEMVIEIRLLNPFDNDLPYSMTDAAKESQFTLKQAGDYTRHSIQGNTNAPGAITTDVQLDDAIFDNFVSRIQNHTKGEPLYGNGAGAINWSSMQVDLDKAALDKINEIHRSILFAVSGTSKTTLGIEESGTTRDTSQVQKDNFTEDAVMPQIEDIIDALNLDYRRNYPEWEKDKYEIILDNPLETNREAELKDIEIRETELNLREALIAKGYEYELASKYAHGEITLEELGEPTLEPEISDEEANLMAASQLGIVLDQTPTEPTPTDGTQKPNLRSAIKPKTGTQRNELATNALPGQEMAPMTPKKFVKKGDNEKRIKEAQKRVKEHAKAQKQAEKDAKGATAQELLGDKAVVDAIEKDGTMDVEAQYTSIKPLVDGSASIIFKTEPVSQKKMAELLYYYRKQGKLSFAAEDGQEIPVENEEQAVNAITTHIKLEEIKKATNQLASRELPKLYDGMNIDMDKLGCIMMNTVKIPVVQYIKDYSADELFEQKRYDQGSVVGETKPHVTLLFGLLENGNTWKNKVDMVLEGWKLKTLTIEEVSYFDLGDSYAVIALVEKTPELVDGHERLTLLPHINTFSEYIPHITLAYVKKDADIDKWVSSLNKKYRGQRVATAGINYGDLPEKAKNHVEDEHDMTNLPKATFPNEGDILALPEITDQEMLDAGFVQDADGDWIPGHDYTDRLNEPEIDIVKKLRAKAMAKNGAETYVQHHHSHDDIEADSYINSNVERAKNALDDEFKDRVILGESDLLRATRRIEEDLVNSYMNGIRNGDFSEFQRIISESEERQVRNELQLALAAFFTLLTPIYAQQLFRERANEFQKQGVFNMSDEIERQIQTQANKGADSHIKTITNDLDEAVRAAVQAEIEGALINIVAHEVQTQNPNVIRRLPNNPNLEDITAEVKKGTFSQKDNPLYKRARQLAREGNGRDAIARALRKEFDNISKNRAITIARHETNRVFNMAQFQADKQFLTEAGLMDNAFKIMKNRADDPCPICAKVIEDSRANPIPFTQNFVNKGEGFKVNYTTKAGNPGTMKLNADYESISAGNIHVNCRCEYVLLVKQADGTFLNAVDHVAKNGGPGSGNFGHGGRPGQIGGSAGKGGSGGSSRTSKPSNKTLAGMVAHAKANGGMTTSVTGNSPSEGIAFAPRKDTERIIKDSDFNEESLDKFVDEHWDTLKQDGMHIGGWFNNDDSNWYLDISKVGPYNKNTIKEAQDAEQLAVFDLKTFNEIKTGDIKDGKYIKSAEPETIYAEAFGRGDQGGVQNSSQKSSTEEEENRTVNKYNPSQPRDGDGQWTDGGGGGSAGPKDQALREVEENESSSPSPDELYDYMDGNLPEREGDPYDSSDYDNSFEGKNQAGRDAWINDHVMQNTESDHDEEIANYVGKKDYSAINTYLRNPEYFSHPNHKAEVERLQPLIEKVKLATQADTVQKDMSTYRAGIFTEDYVNNLRPGTYIKDAGVISTSMSAIYSTEFGARRLSANNKKAADGEAEWMGNVLFRVNSKAGQKGIYADTRRTAGGSEFEWIPAYGSNLYISEAVKFTDSDGRFAGAIVDVDVYQESIPQGFIQTRLFENRLAQNALKKASGDEDRFVWTEEDIELFVPEEETENKFNPGQPRDGEGKWTDGGSGSSSQAPLTSLNPTGGLMVDYKPSDRATAPLGPNMTTLAATTGRNPDTKITVYRGAPSNQKKIVPGDFITDMKELAEAYTGDGNVISKEVRLGDILDDSSEPEGNEYIYRPGADEEIAKKKTENKFNPSQPRDKDGQWSDGGGGGSVVMSEADAKSAIANSAYKEKLYHGTTRDAMESIKSEGMRASTGGMNGAGVYLANAKGTAEAYLPDEVGGMIEMYVDVKNPVRVPSAGQIIKTGNLEGNKVFDMIKQKGVDEGKWSADMDVFTSQDFDFRTWNNLTQEVSVDLMKEHDAIIVENPYDGEVILVRDPKAIKIVGAYAK